MDRSLGLSAAKAMKSIAMIPILFCDLLRRFSVLVAVCWKFFLWRRRPVSDRIYKDQRQQRQEYTAKDVHRVDEVEIPVLAEPLITESTLKRRKRRNLYGHTVFCSTRKTMVSYNRQAFAPVVSFGAGDGSRTHVLSLEG